MSARVFGRRDVFKSAAALLTVGATPGLESGEPAQSRDLGRIAFSDTNAVVETASGKMRGYRERERRRIAGMPLNV